MLGKDGRAGGREERPGFCRVAAGEELKSAAAKSRAGLMAELQIIFNSRYLDASLR